MIVVIISLKIKAMDNDKKNNQNTPKNHLFDLAEIDSVLYPDDNKKNYKY